LKRAYLKVEQDQLESDFREKVSNQLLIAKMKGVKHSFSVRQLILPKKNK